MTRLAILAALCVSLALGGRAVAAPLEAYGKLPAIEDAALSPDGKMLAYEVTDGDNRTIVVKSLATGKVLSGIRAGEHKVRSIAWAGPNHVIIALSVATHLTGFMMGRAEWWTVIDYNLITRKQRPLLDNIADSNEQLERMNVVYGSPDIRFIDGHPYAFATGQVFVDHEGRFGLFKVDLDHDDRSTVVFQGFKNTTGYVVDAHGTPIAEDEYDGDAKRWSLKIWDGHWREVKALDAVIEGPSLIGLGRDGKSIVVRFPEGKEVVTRELSPDGGKWTEVTRDAFDLLYDPATYRLIGQTTRTSEGHHISFYDEADQRTWAAVVKAYKDSEIMLNSFSDDHRRFVLRIDSLTDGPSYALVDMDAHSGDWIGDEYDQLKPEDIGPKQAVAFKAKDGFDLNGYLTLPHGRAAKGLPLIVFPHGGPAGWDGPGFDWWVQAMASRGFAVLQVNFRGSDGFGWDFLSAGFGEWGRKMQTDLSDGVRFLAARGDIDPKRVCIVGASYGGYAALAGAALDTGVYRCAVAVAGISDLPRFLADIREDQGREDTATRRYWLRYLGDRAKLAEISPARQIDRVTIPVLLIHGREDTVVPFVQSQIMVDALKKAGKPADFVVLDREDHHLSHGQTRLQMLRETMNFVEKNNPPN